MNEEDNDLTDPEDAFDASDSPGEQLRNFIRRIQWIDAHLGGDFDLHDRLARLMDDIEYLRHRTSD
jgi:hypothetical protein